MGPFLATDISRRSDSSQCLFGDQPKGMQDTWDIEQQAQDEIDKQVLTGAIVQEHRQWWEQYCDDDQQDFIHY